MGASRVDDCFDPYGNPITYQQWITWADDHPGFSKHVGKTIILGYRVSTVWLGINHGWGGDVLIYETMFFPLGDDYLDLEYEQIRYPSREIAIQGHLDAVNRVGQVEVWR